jgi:GTP-binding protein
MTNESKLLRIETAEFLFGAPDAETIRKQNLPEVAIVGRSNVGKSSFINRFLGRKTARVSGTPGCTRQLNFYQAIGTFDSEPFKFCLVDMPGFGYAKLSKGEREAISRTAVDYLRGRKQVQVVLILNDCRRGAGDDELAVQRICADEGLHSLVIVTKADVLRQNEKSKAIKAVANAYGLEGGDVLVSGTGVPIDPVWKRVLTLVS